MDNIRSRWGRETRSTDRLASLSLSLVAFVRIQFLLFLNRFRRYFAAAAAVFLEELLRRGIFGSDFELLNSGIALFLQGFEVTCRCRDAVIEVS